MSDRREPKRSYGGLVLVGIAFVALAVISALMPEEETRGWEQWLHPMATESEKFSQPAILGGLFSVATNFATVRNHHTARFELSGGGSPQFKSKYGLFGRTGTGLTDTHHPDPFGTTLLVRKDGGKTVIVVLGAGKGASTVNELIVEPVFGNEITPVSSSPAPLPHYPGLRAGSGGGAGLIRINDFSSSDDFDLILQHYETEFGIERVTTDGEVSLNYRTPNTMVLPTGKTSGMRTKTIVGVHAVVTHLIHICHIEGEADTHVIYAMIFR